MSCLLLLVKFLTAYSLIEAQVVHKRSESPNPSNMAHCSRHLHMLNVNLTQIVECMARSANLTAYMEETLWKMDLLERQLAKLQSKPATTEVFVPSPYVNIDDVLKIEGSVAGYNCQSKLHVVQAIRRKLEQVNLMNGRESTLFDWPFERVPAPNKRTINTSIYKGSPEASTVFDNEAQELSCLIARAVERHGANATTVKPNVTN